MPLYGKKKFNAINKHTPRLDGYEKAMGKANYAADLSMPHMLMGGMLRSDYASARIVSINVDKALKIEGVHSVLTHKDIPVIKSWSNYMYITDQVRYIGDVVAIVAAETKELVDEALSMIEVEYEELPAVYTVEEALQEGAHSVHEKYPNNVFTDSEYDILKGDIESGFNEADVVMTREYETQYVEHSYIEPEACLAVHDANDGEMTVYASAQSPFFTRRYIADALEVSIKDVRLVQQTIGGTFGGKEEAIGLISARAALLAKATKRPVKIVMTRQESFYESAKRHPFKFNYKIGAKHSGEITAIEGKLVCNSGAYNNQTQFMNWRASVHSAGPYVIPNVKTKTFGVFTNNIHSGAFRGYSSPQLIFAQEQLMDELADELGIDPVDFRLLNCLKDGSKTATSQEVNNVILDEIIEYTTEQTDFRNKRKQYKNQDSKIYKKGIGMALAYRGCGFGAESVDSSGSMIIANEDGTVMINSGLAENGQGLKTAFAQIAAEGLGVPVEAIRFHGSDTHMTTDSGMTVASRSTAIGAKSMRTAAEKLKHLMIKNAIELSIFPTDSLNSIKELRATPHGSVKGITLADIDQIDIVDGFVVHKVYSQIKVPFADLCVSSLWAGKQMAVYDWVEAEKLVQDHHTGQGKAFPNYSYGCVIAEVEVDTETGYVDVVEVTSSHDVGTVINPSLAKGQIYGGIVMGQGFGVLEEVETNKGRIRQHNFDNYLLPTSVDRPKMNINLFECDDDTGTYGAKSLGEPATEAVAAAIANAVANATGNRIRQNPADLEKVLLGRKLR